MVSDGSNTCNVLPRRQDEIKFILLLFPASCGASLVREEMWEIELFKNIAGKEIFRYIAADVSGYLAITADGSLTNDMRTGDLLSASQSEIKQSHSNLNLNSNLKMQENLC